MLRTAILALVLVASTGAVAQEQTPRQLPSPAVGINRNFTYINQKILDMAQEFPADKYDYRLTKEMRSFGELIVHIASGNVYAAKAGRGEKVSWDELDPKNYAKKADIVAMFQNSIEDATATLKAVPEERFARTLAPWLAVIEHSAEHYGLLVGYYRINGMVPQESRPKTK
jgi:DinB superfamily